MRKTNRQTRKERVRFSLKLVSIPFRLSVFRSNKHFYAQVLDRKGLVVVQASTIEKGSDVQKSYNAQGSAQVGKLMASRLNAAKVDRVVFDRGPYVYHGRVKSFCEAIRENGIQV